MFRLPLAGLQPVGQRRPGGSWSCRGGFGGGAFLVLGGEELLDERERLLRERRRLDDAALDRMVIYRTAGTTGHPITVPHHPVAIRCYEPL